jgi:redox-sensitive bicupin YhaK (pirin superfamily)
MPCRSLKQVISAIATFDGAGVKLLRSLGQSQQRLDPFLMLDEFSSMNADDYIAGFPDHPHRGFKTVTYMLDGNMLHQDHLGNQGLLTSGSAQWMTAGRGIIHSEMPQQESGRMRGFQLWINLPAKEKMKSAAYKDILPEDIPTHNLTQGGRVKVIAGTVQIDNQTLVGPIQGLSTEPLFLDVHILADDYFTLPVPENHNAFIYAYEGNVMIGGETLSTHALGVLSKGDEIEVYADKANASFLILAARPLNEPIVQHGPFVMNTQEEIEQAIRDYRNGKLTH